jgi:hypothetical protein
MEAAVADGLLHMFVLICAFLLPIPSKCAIPDLPVPRTVPPSVPGATTSLAGSDDVPAPCLTLHLFPFHVIEYTR